MKPTLLFRIYTAGTEKKPVYQVQYRVLTDDGNGTYKAGEWLPYFRPAMSGGSIKVGTKPLETGWQWKARASLAKARVGADKLLAILFPPPKAAEVVAPQAAPMPQPLFAKADDAPLLVSP